MKAELFNKTEEALMNFLWTQEENLCVAEILERWDGRDFTDRHLRVIISSLEEKGAIACCGAKLRGRQYSRVFRCLISKEEYYARVLNVNDVSLPKLLQVETVALAKVGNRENLNELIRSLQEIIDEFQAQGDGDGKGNGA